MRHIGLGQVVRSSHCSGGLASCHGRLGRLRVWTATSDVVMDKHGRIAMGLGTFFSLLIGFVLMALMFLSSRSGHDEAADPFRNKREPPGE
jgi:hypothetical protein